MRIKTTRGRIGGRPFPALALAIGLVLGGCTEEETMDRVPDQLILGSEHTRELADGESHPYEIVLESGHYVRVVVDQQGVDVALELADPEGEQVLYVDSPIGRQGSETLVAVAASSGTYRLDVLCSEPEAPQGTYHLRVTDLRQATQEDRDRDSAERAIAEGDQLRRQSTKESLAEAVERYRSGLALFQGLQDRDREADSYFRIGLAYMTFDEFEAASDHFESALALFRRTSRVRKAASTLNYLGLIRREKNQPDEARQRFDEALKLSRGTYPSIASSALNNIGLLFRDQGEWDHALGAFEQSLALIRETREPRKEISILGNISDLLTEQGKLKEAEDQVDRALAILEVHKIPRQKAFRLGKRGDLRARQGHFADAVADLEQALAIWREIGSTKGVTVSHNRLGTTYYLNHQFDLARKHYESALAEARKNSDTREEAFVLINLGRLNLSSGDRVGKPQMALDYFDLATRLLERVGEPSIAASSLWGGAKALYELGKFEAALERLDQSLGNVEIMRSETGRQGLRISFFATKQHYFDLQIDCLMRLHEQMAGQGFDALAFETSERRRGRALLDILGESAAELRKGIDPDLLDSELRIQAELGELDRKIDMMEQAGGVDSRVEEVADQQRKKLDELDAIRARIRRSSPSYGQVSTGPRSLREIRRRLLDRQSALLVYSLGEERSCLWWVSKDSFHSFLLPPRAEIEKAASLAYDLLQVRRDGARDRRQKVLDDLSRVLLGPVAEMLASQRLLLIAEGNLLHFPFGVLPKPGTKAPLVKDHEIVYLPSASTVLALREQLADRALAPHPIAIFADPALAPDEDRMDAEAPAADFDRDLERSAKDLNISSFTPLPYSRLEAQEISKLFGGEAKLFLGYDASKAKVLRGAIAHYQILHFATHGLLNDKTPDLSGLLLSRVDEDQNRVDGLLRVHDLYGLHFDAELAVLSACRTGLGKEVRGEGLLGLTRGFMYAGVPRVVVSLWSVSDEGTSEFMKRYYWALSEGGASPSLALRAAQVSLLDEERWNHPYYWAPFVIQGEWRSPRETEDGIEEEATGMGDQMSDNPDFPIPFCGDFPEPWKSKICEILFKLRNRPVRSRETTRGEKAAAEISDSDGEEPAPELVYFNGIDALTGDYSHPPVQDEKVALSVLGMRRDWAEERDLRWSHEQFRDRGVDRRPMPDVNPKDLASAGWGVIFAESTPPDVRRALERLLDHRKEQATKKEERYFRKLEYKKGKSKQEFFRDHDVEPGPAHPRDLPYYLLLVGSPEEIPHRFQYLLDMQYAVGRIHFDTVEEYESYANSVVEAERGIVHVRPEAAFFPVRHRDDPPTQRAFKRLVKPLFDRFGEDCPEWPSRIVDPATKEKLGRLFGGGEAPAFLFTAAHGLRFPTGHPLQRTHQGALVCDGWFGGPPSLDYCFSADDIKDEARFHGLIAFLFGCFSAGTPHKTDFRLRAFSNPQLAPKAMISPLAKRLLAHPAGGALAVVGHVDRSWATSLGRTSKGDGSRHFLALLQCLLDGHPIGSAMDWMNEYFAEISTELTVALDVRREPLNGEEPSKVESLKKTAALWRFNNDARNLTVLGDPAVRLAVGIDGGDQRTAASADRRAQGRPSISDVLKRLKGREPVDLSIDLAEAVRIEREGGEIS